MARNKFNYKDITFDSQEEIAFYKWLEEAKILGIVEHWDYQPESFKLFDKATVSISKQLKTKTKELEKTILQQHVYTADYYIKFNESIKEFNTHLKNIDLLNRTDIWIDIKGGFGSFGSHSNFSVESKWVWQKYGILTEKIIPDKFFRHTWVPEDCRFTPKTLQEKKKYIGYNTFEVITNKIMRDKLEWLK